MATKKTERRLRRSRSAIASDSRGVIAVAAALVAVSLSGNAFSQAAIPAAPASEAERLEAIARGAAGLPPAPTPSGVRIGATVSTTFTDNGGLRPADSKKADTLFEVNPYAVANANRPDVRGTVSYGLRAITSANGTVDNRILHDLRGAGDIALIGDSFRLNARALVNDINASPFSVSAADSATTPTGNRVRYQRYELSPYYTGSINNLADYQLRYRASYSDAGLPQIKTTEQSLSALLRGNNEMSAINWMSTIQGSQRRFDNDFRYGSSAFSFTGLAAPSTSFRGGISANYSRVDIVIDEKGRNEGWGPGVFAQWTPSTRTSFNLTASKQYYGNIGNLRFVHRASDWVFSLNGTRALLSPIESNILFLDPTQQFGVHESRPVANPIVDGLVQQGLLNPAGSLFSSGISAAALALDNRVNVSLGYLGAADAVVFTLYSSRLTAVPLSAEATAGLPRVLGGTLTDGNGAAALYRHFLSATSSLLFRASLSNWRNEGADAATQLRSYTAGYYNRWSPYFGGAIEYRNNRQRSSGTASAGYDQHALIVIIDARY